MLVFKCYSRNFYIKREHVFCFSNISIYIIEPILFLNSLIVENINISTQNALLNELQMTTKTC